MSQDARQSYGFQALPLSPVETGTNILVAGPPFAGTNEVALRTLACDETGREGVLLLAIDESGHDLVDAYTDVGATFDRSRMAAIECDTAGSDHDDNIRTVASPADLTGIGIEFSSLYEDLFNEGIERVRTGLFTVSTLLMYADDIQPVYRFLHTLTGRVRTADGFGACVVDPSATDDQTLNSIAQVFDGRIDVRETDDSGRQVRAQGLSDQPDGWQSL